MKGVTNMWLFIGYMGGLLTAAVVQCLLTWLPAPRQGALIAAPAVPPATHTWQENRNFLYYDGTEMPIEEEQNEQ